ncbi:MAG: type secretion system sortase PorU [Bacteroidota bacterium]|jgi:hypothetical protein
MRRVSKILCGIAILCSLAKFSIAQVRTSSTEQNSADVVLPAVATVINKSTQLEISEKVWLKDFSTVVPELYDVQSEVLTNAKVEDGIILPKAFIPYAVTGFEQKKPFAFIQVPIYIQESNGTIRKITSYKYRYTEQAAVRKTRGNRSYAAHSVLASGSFYKISVGGNGMYKMDYNFVKTKIGVDPANVDVTKINIYGNGGTMLSENNAIIPEDDLVPNHIQLVGMADGKWDAGDYVVFYASGPHAIVADSQSKTLSHAFNLYENASYYFVNFDKEPTKQIQTANLGAAATTTVTAFDDYQFQESDEYNFGKFGKLWWGYRMGNSFGNSKSFSFNVPNIVSTVPAQVTAYVGAVGSSGYSTITLSANGQNLGNASLQYIGNEFYDPTIRAKKLSSPLSTTNSTIDVNVDFAGGNDFTSGYIDYVSVYTRRQLVQNGTAMRFRDWQSVGAGAVAQYNLQSSSTPNVWDITDPLRPLSMALTSSGTTHSFKQSASTLHEFISWDGSQFVEPSYVGTVANQDLHGLGAVDLVVITHSNFTTEANRLAQYHSTKNGLRTVVVNVQQVYNEFSAGSQDLAALRNFTKMFYDRASTAADMPKSILLFGDASYDYKGRISTFGNFVPSHETRESISKITGFCSDDFFGMLDDNENINNFDIANTIDIGVGRIPCKTAAEAKAVVDKIINYESANSYGAWKNNLTFCSDNGDNSVHAVDAEIMSSTAAANFPEGNMYKIHVDGYPLEATAAGARAPQAKQALDANMYNGTLIVNYNGHGGPAAWCEERLFTEGDIANYTNYNKLPLFITATCDFAPFNQPETYSAGEKLLLYDKGGAIALMTTTQLVYQAENRIMNRDYMSVAFTKQANGKIPSLGEAYRLSKNITYVNAVPEYTGSNFRKFALLGDPALHLAIPQLKVVADSLNGKSLALLADTLRALNKYTLSGRVLDENGATNTAFNGTVNISIFDKKRKLQTLANTNNSPKINYTLQNAVVFRGSATVINGKYSVSFIVPKDIDYSIGKGKISMYAYSSAIDATGADTNIVIGGVGNTTITDNEGPIVKPFMNNNKFINGGMTAPNSTLYIELEDDNGINTTGNSVGHDITAILDGNTAEPIVLNTFYEAAKDDYTKGVVRYPFKGLKPGLHTITVKAWDVLNNSGTGSVDFVVQESTEAQIDRVYNYPNPFTTSTNFCFDHNQSGATLYITVEIYAVSGALVKTIQNIRFGESSRIDDIAWDGTDQMGEKLGRGTYLYKIYYKSNIGKSAFKYQKLVIL